jgi:hypothetical protein
MREVEALFAESTGRVDLYAWFNGNDLTEDDTLSFALKGTIDPDSMAQAIRSVIQLTYRDKT